MSLPKITPQIPSHTSPLPKSIGGNPPISGRLGSIVLAIKAVWSTIIGTIVYLFHCLSSPFYSLLFRNISHQPPSKNQKAVSKEEGGNADKNPSSPIGQDISSQPNLLNSALINIDPDISPSHKKGSSEDQSNSSDSDMKNPESGKNSPSSPSPLESSPSSRSSTPSPYSSSTQKTPSSSNSSPKSQSSRSSRSTTPESPKKENSPSPSISSEQPSENDGDDIDSDDEIEFQVLEINGQKVDPDPTNPSNNVDLSESLIFVDEKDGQGEASNPLAQSAVDLSQSYFGNLDQSIELGQAQDSPWSPTAIFNKYCKEYHDPTKAQKYRAWFVGLMDSLEEVFKTQNTSLEKTFDYFLALDPSKNSLIYHTKKAIEILQLPDQYESARQQYQAFTQKLRDAINSLQYQNPTSDGEKKAENLIDEICYIRYTNVHIYGYMEEVIDRVVLSSIKSEEKKAAPANKNRVEITKDKSVSLQTMAQKLEDDRIDIKQAPHELKKPKFALLTQKAKGGINIGFDPSLEVNVSYVDSDLTFRSASSHLPKQQEEKGQEPEEKTVRVLRFCTPTKESGPFSRAEIVPEFRAFLKSGEKRKENFLYINHQKLTGSEANRSTAIGNLDHKHKNFFYVALPMDEDFFEQTAKMSEIAAYKKLIAGSIKKNTNGFAFSKKTQLDNTEVEDLLNHVHEIYFQNRTSFGQGNNKESSESPEEKKSAFLMTFYSCLTEYLIHKHNIRYTSSVCKDNIDRGNASRSSNEARYYLLLNQENDPETLNTQRIKVSAHPFLAKKQEIIPSRLAFLRSVWSHYASLTQEQRQKIKKTPLMVKGKSWKIKNFTQPKRGRAKAFPTAQTASEQEYQKILERAEGVQPKEPSSQKGQKPQKPHYTTYSKVQIAKNFVPYLENKEKKKAIEETLRKLENGDNSQIIQDEKEETKTELEKLLLEAWNEDVKGKNSKTPKSKEYVLHQLRRDIEEGKFVVSINNEKVEEKPFEPLEKLVKGIYGKEQTSLKILSLMQQGVLSDILQELSERFNSANLGYSVGQDKSPIQLRVTTDKDKKSLQTIQLQKTFLLQKISNDIQIIKTIQTTTTFYLSDLNDPYMRTNWSFA